MKKLKIFVYLMHTVHDSNLNNVYYIVLLVYEHFNCTIVREDSQFAQRLSKRL